MADSCCPGNTTASPTVPTISIYSNAGRFRRGISLPSSCRSRTWQLVTCKENHQSFGSAPSDYEAASCQPTHLPATSCVGFVCQPICSCTACYEPSTVQSPCPASSCQPSCSESTSCCESSSCQQSSYQEPVCMSGSCQLACDQPASCDPKSCPPSCCEGEQQLGRQQGEQQGGGQQGLQQGEQQGEQQLGRQQGAQQGGGQQGLQQGEQQLGRQQGAQQGVQQLGLQQVVVQQVVLQQLGWQQGEQQLMVSGRRVGSWSQQLGLQQVVVQQVVLQQLGWQQGEQHMVSGVEGGFLFTGPQQNEDVQECHFHDTNEQMFLDETSASKSQICLETQSISKCFKETIAPVAEKR
ncbi:Keratin-associated protein 29-1 [Galemys pyrenaicus]|uniref:Keratin-associated protein 29-1 n=1 Tax=Galemys pyrenaicus TaxID=202257 RepID=A0A8J6A312_GALPY|nr:Keratin-associated protein 29-1 [Galemys pyrenaicus]